MKNPNKGSGGKGPSYTGTPAASDSASAGAGSRRSRWESDEKPASDRPPPSNSSSKPLKPKESPAGPSAASPVVTPKDHLAGQGAAPPNSGSRPVGPPLPQPVAYGFHNLDRRTIMLADGTVRSYFALPPDYPLDPAPITDPFYPYVPAGRPGFGHGPEPVPLGFDRHFPGGRLSPEDFRGPLPPTVRSSGTGPEQDYWPSVQSETARGLMEGGSSSSSLKRKYGEEDELAWHRQHVLQYGNPNGIPSGSGPGVDRGEYFGRSGSPLRPDHQNELRQPKHMKVVGGEGYEDLPPRRSRGDDAPAALSDVDPQALKRAFLKFSKTINENSMNRKNYLENGKNGALQCVVCARASRNFSDVHALIMHAHSSQNAELRVDHLGLYKALCVLMGWNYLKAPENSRANLLLSADDAQANRDDLIVWPPAVVIHNTNSGRRKDGRMDGMGNKEMDTKLKELGFGGGKSKSVYGKEGHMGVTVVKFANTQSGLKEAERLAEYFEKDNRGRRGWMHVQASWSADEDRNPALVKVDEKTGEKKRVFYGYLATASDLEKLEYDMRKKADIKSRRDLDLSD